MTRYIVVDYGLCNLNSVNNALKFLGCHVSISADPKEIAGADALILPGVGAFGEAMSNMRKGGQVEALHQAVIEEGKPILGICLGFQLFGAGSEESGNHEGLGWLDGAVTRMPVTGGLRLPHIGWNDIHMEKEMPLMKGIPDNNFYFVHSFAFNEIKDESQKAVCSYGSTFVAAAQKANIMGTQFHPEKSHISGLKVLSNFMSYCDDLYA